MCNIAPVLTRTGVFYVVKTLVPQPREWQTTSEVADRPANELRGGRPPDMANQASDLRGGRPPGKRPQRRQTGVADHHKKDKEKTV